MIRINLLPIKQDRRKEAGRNQIIIGFLILLLEMSIIFALYLEVSANINEQKNANNSLETQVKRIESSIKGHNRILEQISEFEKRQKAIDNLITARTGPVHVLLEVSRILSKSGRPTMNNDVYQTMIKQNPARSYDENWDYRKIWIDSFREQDKHVKITGQGSTHEDVAEFLRRINLSDFFVSSELISTKLAAPKISKDGFSLINPDLVVFFEISATVRYR